MASPVNPGADSLELIAASFLIKCSSGMAAAFMISAGIRWMLSSLSDFKLPYNWRAAPACTNCRAQFCG